MEQGAKEAMEEGVNYEPKYHTDLYSRELRKGDVVTHFLENRQYVITKMLRTNDVMLDPVEGAKRNGFSRCPCECLIKVL